MTPYANVVNNLPSHLKQYVVDQDYSRYTAMDQATWRFILRQLKSFLSQNAHECYVDGLQKTGISVEEIPRIDVMCEKLQKFGWTALPVSGFIPPAAFMELQSLNVLPIACDMRSMDHILYTPAPDIVHEAAGHAPILVDPQFADYLKKYASVAKKAILSHEDLAQYEAIRDLSDIKESPQSTAADIAAAEERLKKVNASMTFVSEAALLGRMNWWTAEYGLIGDLRHPRIFGAGLLSSVGESRATASVKKVPLTVDCIETSYDITEQQPQLFVTPSFQHLTEVLHQLENKMAFKRGGAYGLQVAQQARTVNTVELDSGVQISGRVTEFTVNHDRVDFFKMDGPVQICCDGTQLPQQGPERHPHGFSSPLGLTEQDLKKLNLKKGERCRIQWPSGIELNAKVEDFLYSSNNKLMVVTFSDCTITDGDHSLYKPEWGLFDLVVGKKVTSVFAGPADRKAYGLTDIFVKRLVPRKSFTDQELKLEKLYFSLRELRNSSKDKLQKQETLHQLLEKLNTEFPKEWLAYLEIFEMCVPLQMDSDFKEQVLRQLRAIEEQSPQKKEYIQLGLTLAEKAI